MKRYRNEKGQLTISLEEIKKKTIIEASNYYKPGSIYLNVADGREYVYLFPVPGDGELAHFKSFDGYNLFIPIDSLGTFLPDVASDGTELLFVEQTQYWCSNEDRQIGARVLFRLSFLKKERKLSK